MNFTYRKGTKTDLYELKKLAIKSWSPFKQSLTEDNWANLKRTIENDETYEKLLEQSHCIVCTKNGEKIIGMAFLVSSGHPTDIYLKEWSYIRLVSVDPGYSGLGIGRTLTTMCMDLAKQNGEDIIALHTSEIMDKARHLYESLGFRVLKEIDHRLGKRYWLYKIDLKEIN
ncbi:GNAT family N-acetyltransferase [Confluentibacter lentus]|uniref:GNAT family N-acetyltransferase n=1 Tax=Confluentibacter lentus TaxID=1699412 RepID=UPI000C290E6B|nr:N-acetyltransferase [Confluentibacter lentus]